MLSLLTGSPLTQVEYASAKPTLRRLCSQVSQTAYVGPSGAFDDLFNHCCAPNLVVRTIDKQRVFVPRRRVLAGEELTWDYATVVSDRRTMFACRCGSLRCRGRIGMFSQVPLPVRATHLRERAARHRFDDVPSEGARPPHASHLFVRPTSSTGLGLHTQRSFQKGEAVFRLAGRERRFVSRTPWDGRAFPNWILIGRDRWVEPTAPFTALNHSCDPNLAVRGLRDYVALRDIAAGEELTVDYSILNDERHWSMRCLCGSALCRGTIRSVHSLPRDVANRYLPHISPHMLGTWRRAQLSSDPGFELESAVEAEDLTNTRELRHA